MKIRGATEDVIAGMVQAAVLQGFDARQQHFYREALRNLVRLAKSEQVTEMRASVKKLVGVAACAVERSRRQRGGDDRLQQQFEFK